MCIYAAGEGAERFRNLLEGEGSFLHVWPTSYLGTVGISRTLYGGITTSKRCGRQKSEWEVEGKKD